MTRLASMSACAKTYAYAVTCALVSTGCAAGAPPPIPLNPVRFLLVNTAPASSGDSLTSDGLARAATVRKRIADEGPVLFVAAGNVLHEPAGAAQQSAVAALNAARLDYATFGSEELALSSDSLAKRIDASKFRWLSSNCTLPSHTTAKGVPNLVPWDTLRISTHKIGIFGVTAGVNEPSTADANVATHVRCTNPDSAARRAIDTLAAQGADLIVALTYQSTDADRNLLLRESRLQLVLGGGENSEHSLLVGGRQVLKAAPDAQSAQFVTLWGGKDAWRQAVGLVPIDSRVPVDSAVTRAETGKTNPD